MKNKIFILRLSVLGVIVLALGWAISMAITEDDSLVEAGKPAPDFSLVNTDGEMVQLSDYRGQGVFINFWASWCEPCKEEMPDMQRQYELQKDKGVEILAINIAESELRATNFAERLNLTFPILLDRDRSVTRQYDFIPLPTSFFVDAEGIVVAKIEGMMSEEIIKEHMEMIQPN